MPFKPFWKLTWASKHEALGKRMRHFNERCQDYTAFANSFVDSCADPNLKRAA